MRLGSLGLIGAALAVTSPATAATVYDISFNTAARNGVNALLDLQFVRVDTDGDGTRDPASPLTLTLSNFATDGALGSQEESDGQVAGSLPGTLTFGNVTDFNAYLREITLGDLTTFRLTFGGPGLDAGAFGQTVFGISAYDRAEFNSGVFAPILSDADGIAAIFLVRDGRISFETPNTPETGRPSITVTAVVPEPATWAMLVGGFGLVGGAMRVRRRAVAFA